MTPATVFKAMADRTRQRTLIALCRHELSVSELVEVLAQPQSTVSRHLKTLREAGLIRDRRNGSTVLYSVAVRESEDNGQDDLSGRLLSWAAEQPLTEGMESRLEGVIRKRRDMSRRFFDRVGRQWDALREDSFGASFHLEAFTALLPRTWTVADIGTGTGYLLPVLARHFEQVIGVEPVDKMLETARHRLAHLGIGNVDLRPGELAAVPIADSSVDLATAMLVLHHVPTPREAVAELHRILRTSGRVLIVEQTAHGDEPFHERMQDRWWGFEPEELARWLEAAGFAEVCTTRLATIEPGAGAPNLFVVTGRKKGAALRPE
jgi:ArsR family transcriptional regulator